MASDNKYDRQERLWGVTGQRSLRASRILLLGCNATGVESLRNLVLPACGEIYLVDNRLVEQRDLGNNFFVTQEDIGKPIAEVCCQNLLEMNEDVKGQFEVKNVDELLDDEKFLSGFNVVIASDLQEEQVKRISSSCYNLRYVSDTKLFVLNSMGMIGLLRSQLNTHHILNPQKSADFLNMGNFYTLEPFETLQKFADSYDFQFLIEQTKEYYRINKEMEQQEEGKEYQVPENFEEIKKNYQKFKYVPYPIILLKAYSIWFQENKALPTKAPEKENLKTLIKSWYNFLILDDQTTFREAIDNLFKKAVTTSSKKLTPNLLRLFDHPECVNQCPKSSDFWVIIKACKLFVDQTGFLPVSYLDFPDFTTQTQTYLALRQVYIDKFNSDLNQISQIASSISEGRVVNQELLKECIQRITQITFCDNKAIFQQNYSNFKLLNSQKQVWSLLSVFKGLLEYQDQNKQTTINEQSFSAFKEWLTAKGIEARDEDIHEILQNYQKQINSFSTTLGSIASQEALKAITHQFMPLENTYFINQYQTKYLTADFSV